VRPDPPSADVPVRRRERFFCFRHMSGIIPVLSHDNRGQEGLAPPVIEEGGSMQVFDPVNRVGQGFRAG
jgi:hypothetical protein